MNNKKIFSVKMFWQSFLQLKVIGFISTILMVLITCVPICISAVNIKSNIEYAGVEKASRYVKLVDGNDFIPILILTFAIITPVLVLFAWNFLNKRNTSDFYHSLAYTRLNLYLTKIAAFVLWILIMYASIFLSAAILYKIFKTCYIVNYGSILSVFFSEFICCLLCAAAATLACSITGNIFSNICLTGLILFFPRFIILMVQVTVVSIVYFASSEHFVSILDNSYNMIVGQVFSVFTGSSLDGVINVAHSKIYTFVLALIYFVTGCLLFIRRKSETAGKPTLSWKLQFVIRTVIGFSISIIGVISFVGAVRNADIEKSQSILYVVITFIVAAVVVIVYELIASRKTHRVIKAIPSIITAYVLAAVFGVIVNIGIGSMINYQPDASKIKYIKINTGNGSYVYDKDYFSDVFSQVKIDDIDAINSIVNSMKDNMEIYNTSDEYSAIFQNGDYSPVTVYIKDGIWGRYRTVYVKEKDIQTIINGAVKNDEFCKKYKKLPQYEEAVISWSDNMSDEDSKKLYNTFLDEVSKMSFEDWYLTVNGRKRGVSLAYVDISFSLNGTKYTSEVLIGDKMPNTLQAYMNAVNKYVAENKKDSYESMCNYFDNIETEKNKDNYTCYISVYDVENNTQSRIWSENMDGNKIVPDLKENLKNISPEKKFDLTKPVIEIIFYGNRSGGSFSYFFQMDGYDSLDDFNNQGPIGL